MKPPSKETLALHALITYAEGNYKKIEKLLALHGTALRTLESLKSNIDLEKAWDDIRAEDISFIPRTDFKMRLTEMPWQPFGLYLKGALFDEAPHIAIVGTRRATEEGRALAREFGNFFGACGVSLVSGLALGIDGEAHRGTLEALGKTIAVLPCGLDRIYPREHEFLAKEILSSGGTLVSEYPLGSISYPARFIERNRIISALSRGVIVIEAPEGSGALATARFALEQNRDVFVVPGPMKHPNYAGSHTLIRDGAELISSPEDVLFSLGIERKQTKQKVVTNHILLDENKKAILNCLQALSAQSAEEIAVHASLSPDVVQQELALLIISNLIKEESSGRYIRNI